MTARAAIAHAARRIAAVSDTARLDAELLLAHALDIEWGELVLAVDRVAVPGEYAALVARRLAAEPVAYIVGYRDFWTVRIAVGPGVLVPRPDSETLIAAAAEHFGGAGPGRVLDLGTGPGTLLCAALDQWPGARGVGMEVSAAARGYAMRNVAALEQGGRASIVAGDWTMAGWDAALGGPFDLVFANPPYIADGTPLMADVADHEPHGALFAGPDGLDDYRRIVPALPGLLAAGGVAILELGAGQADAVAALANAAGLAAAHRPDLGGHVRALVLTRP